MEKELARVVDALAGADRRFDVVFQFSIARCREGATDGHGARANRTPGATNAAYPMRNP